MKRTRKTRPSRKAGLLTTQQLCDQAGIKRMSFNRKRDRLGLVPAGETTGSTGVRIHLWDPALVEQLKLAKKYGRQSTTTIE